ncbi:RILP-like protein 1 isoform X1 [Pomacea canaliculata]|uniref:RILP-like protein 1 isoform X1 n=1 Tax=Pomacea canaliculata TaxID=400727 RepID=UPI000D73B37D|nr:RILP-like protein 1 isoform X1 [Pomacea canaliculata]
MATEIYQDVTVTDVKEQAAGIAREFDKLINNYGNDAVTELMPKVIRALEQLESLATRFERDNDEIAQLRSTVEKLELEKTGKAQERAKFEQELEQIEENWQTEVREPLTVVGKLQEENKRLKKPLHYEKHSVAEKVSAKHRETEEQEIKVLTKLKETVYKQREELRSLKHELSQKAVDCDALQAQVEQIARVNIDLRRKNNTQRKQARVLLQEKSELEIALREKDAEVDKVKTMLSEQEKFEEQRAAVRAAIQEQRESEERNEEEEDSPFSDDVTSTVMTDSTTTATSSSPEIDRRTASVNSLGLDMEGKLIIDMKDPNRPRFTLQEVKQLLFERNELKTRLIEVEEELNHYRLREPGAPEDENQDESVIIRVQVWFYRKVVEWYTCFTSFSKSIDNRKSSFSGEEVLVYGPINKEPDEKLFGRKESGIRKSFLSLLEAGLFKYLLLQQFQKRCP